MPPLGNDNLRIRRVNNFIGERQQAVPLHDDPPLVTQGNAGNRGAGAGLNGGGGGMGTYWRIVEEMPPLEEEGRIFVRPGRRQPKDEKGRSEKDFKLEIDEDDNHECTEIV